MHIDQLYSKDINAKEMSRENLKAKDNQHWKKEMQMISEANGNIQFKICVKVSRQVRHTDPSHKSAIPG